MAHNTLADLRTTKGLSHRQLAEACETSAYNLKRVEAGHVRLTPALRNKLAAVLGVAPSEVAVQ